MIFTPTAIAGVVIIDIQPITDDRGFFARGWCEREFEQAGLQPTLRQMNIGFSKRRGTVRGLHFQRPPAAEVKIVRCTRGAIFDVAVDLRRDSPTFQQWVGVELTADNHRLLYVPEGCATGYQTLVDDTEMCYQTSQFYASQAATGVRFNDPAFGISWPLEPTAMSEQDRRWPDFSPSLGVSLSPAAP
jgi:dTDP-4-dehydrorhamnose 3,5-epimerase